MKITKSELQQIINEEIEKMVSEGELDEGLRDIFAGIKAGAGKVGSDVSSYASGVKKVAQQGYTVSRLKTELMDVNKLINSAKLKIAQLDVAQRGLGLGLELENVLSLLSKATNETGMKYNEIARGATARINAPASPEPTAEISPPSSKKPVSPERLAKQRAALAAAAPTAPTPATAE